MKKSIEQDKKLIRESIFRRFTSGVVAFIGLGSVVLMPFTLAFMVDSMSKWDLVFGGFALLVLEGFAALLAFQIVAVLRK